MLKRAKSKPCYCFFNAKKLYYGIFLFLKSQNIKRTNQKIAKNKIHRRKTENKRKEINYKNKK
jgi:hypothetical protein